MNKVEELEKEIEKIKIRNKQVEADKAWETSWSRKVFILFLTYLVVVLFFKITKLENPLTNAIVPTLGFFLSTLTIPFVKKIWLKKYQNKNE